jgi:photosystem II stability/assembly factor-like uncharacterized protein
MTKRLALAILVCAIAITDLCEATSTPIDINFFQVIVGPPGKLVATTTFGVYQSSDDGSHWVQSLGGTAVKLAQQGQNLFAVDSSGRRYRSRDFGVTWIEDGLVDGNHKVLMEKAALFYGTYYGCVDESLQISHDIGQNWVRVPLEDHCYDVAANRESVYVLGAKGLRISKDRGAHWRLETSPIFSSFARLFVDQRGTVYAQAIGAHAGIFVSRDGGTRWQLVDFQLPPQGDRRILFTRKDDLYILVGGTHTGLPRAYYRYIDGKSVTKLNLDDQPYIDIQVAEDGTLYAVSYHYISKSVDQGNTWSTLGRAGISAQPIVNSR